MIKYKVIWARTRMSCVIPKHTKYCLKYIPGKITTALPGTLGIMVFKTRHQAENFKIWFLENSDFYKIIRVEPVGKYVSLRNKFICRVYKPCVTKDLNKFYRSEQVEFRDPPPGTQCYRAVKVIT